MALQTIGQTVLAVVVVIALVRLNGLRSFSKMSSFDFALTVAAGSVLATMMTTPDPPWPALIALATLFASRFVISLARAHFPSMQRATDNSPLMLMYDGQLFEANLTRARVTLPELRSKLREADATRLSGVRAVVFEATGDVSVLTGDHVDDELLADVSWGDAPRPDRRTDQNQS
ncbi:DUF421 domain-containing protein [Pseudohalocynthiibacter aestuariivivens]|nr:YetF domain-containing protein [Pseudohalocynthiibacter aestuariivivens]QIE46087.1 DUF421 domain-containing protein [Pseudohalocynthiibacter aestuariivivens]